MKATDIFGGLAGVARYRALLFGLFIPRVNGLVFEITWSKRRLPDAINLTLSLLAFIRLDRFLDNTISLLELLYLFGLLLIRGNMFSDTNSAKTFRFRSAAQLTLAWLNNWGILLAGCI